MINIIQRTRRLLQIFHIFYYFRLNEWFPPYLSFRILKVVYYLNPMNWRASPQALSGERLRLALQALGPLFIKLGQLLSTRRDWIPLEVIVELEKLQDQVTPFPAEQACKIIEANLKAPISTLFSEFDYKPLASASIAQVHAARLPTGEAVVVKVLRPHIQQQIERDISLLNTLARLAEYASSLQRLCPREVVAELERSLQDELNLMQEAANASQLRRNATHDHYLKIPQIYWAYTREQVLVTERIYAVSLNNYTTLQQSKVNFHQLAKQAIKLFFTQVFRDCFFHADLHPGNIFISIEDPTHPYYCLVDFGIVGTLSRFDQRYLAENLIAFFKRDYQRVAMLHLESGWIPPETKVTAFASAIRAVCEPVFDRPLQEISIGQLLLQLFQTARRFQMPIQPQLLLLQKTLFSIESISRKLDPNIDLWETAKPLIEHWLRQQVGPRIFIKKLREAVPQWTEKLPELPLLLYQHLSKQIESPTQKPHQATEKQPVTYPLLVLKGLGSLLVLTAGLQLAEPQILQPLLQSPMTSVGIIALGTLLVAI